jgi:hypothetical protein
MGKIFRRVLGMSLLLALYGCGGGVSRFTPNAAGDWEIAATSASTGTTDLIQVRLTQSANNANGLGAVLYNEQNGNIRLGGSCPVGDGKNSVTLVFADFGSSLQSTFNEGGYTFSGSGQSDGKTMTGTYAATAESGCQDAGNWTATKTPPLNASFSGSPDPSLLVQLKITEAASNHSVTVNGTLSGAVTATLSIAGSYVGNAISGLLTVTIPNQPPLTKPMNIYYSPSQKAIYVFEADGTFDGKFDQV